LPECLHRPALLQWAPDSIIVDCFPAQEAPWPVVCLLPSGFCLPCSGSPAASSCSWTRWCKNPRCAYRTLPSARLT
tara:strand:- start:120209 stop:120436 length:228 start_codon:yes stop_codon:yes gene_type:complete